MSGPYHLITFLGNHDYKTTRYQWPGDGQPCEHETEYVAEAICALLPIKTATVIATQTSQDKHVPALRDRLAKTLGSDDAIHVEQIGESLETSSLWGFFKTLRTVIRKTDRPIYLDITHGWRAVPFFASSAVEFAVANEFAKHPIRILYGEFRDPSPTLSPLHDLTLTLDVLQWSRSINLFLRSGNASDVVKPTRNLGNELSRAWAQGGRQGEKPPMEQLAKALQRFSDDLLTVRTTALIHGENASANKLCNAVEDCRGQLQNHLPPLAAVLDQIKEMASPLITDERFSHPNGQKAMANLARLYLKLGRYAEAAAVVREAEITAHACQQADLPGDDYSREHREAAEEVWRKTDEDHARSIAEIRNDINHAGFQPQPLPGDKLRERIKKMTPKHQDGTHNE